MDENKSVKVSLGTVICIVIILILSFALIIVYYFGFVAEENSIEKSNLDTNMFLGTPTKNSLFVFRDTYQKQFDKTKIKVYNNKS